LVIFNQHQYEIGIVQHYLENEDEKSNILYMIIGIIAFVAVLIIGIVCCLKCRRKKTTIQLEFNNFSKP